MTALFDEKIALVTGAGRGIGKAIANKLAAQGAQVICVSKSESSCGAAAEAINAEGGKAVAMAVDVSDNAAVKSACESILEEYKRVDIIVNNAGITKDGLLLRMSEEDWDDVLKTNLYSCFYWVKGLLHPMTRNRWGRIINIASVSGIMGNPGQVNYAAAKAGMIGFAKALAKEVAARNITVNVVAPGFTSTDMTSSLKEEYIKEIEKMIPLKRFGTPEEVAELVSYVASEAASYMTGKVFSIDGGMII